MVCSQVQVGRRNSSNPPLGFRCKRLRFIVTCGRYDNFVAMNVRCSGCGGRQLRLFFRLLFDLGDLLSLLGRRGDLHAQDDVADFGLGQRRYVDAVKKIEKLLRVYFFQ